ncbi:MAG: 2-dehydropantoate 2-reductase [Lachnospiraceae bacterium]|nr:2-dehydropantoate 2-reductase [Lachnospiraceae bacterium]
MKIYVDYDDCLCETARAFTEIAARLFGKNVPYEKVHFFNLQDSFQLNDEEYEQLMTEGHRPEILLSYEETPGASQTLNEWMDQGHEIFIITGRPYSSFEASRRWLDEHGLEKVNLYFLNKYGRDSFIKNSDFNLELEDYYKMHFDYAIEDSPKAFRFFEHLPELKVMVYDRPWNQTCELPSSNYLRCTNWKEIKNAIQLQGKDMQ